MKRGLTFAARLMLWLVGFQVLLWLSLYPLYFSSLAQTVRQIENPLLEEEIKKTWDRAKEWEDQNPNLRQDLNWKTLTDGLTGIRREYEGRQALNGDVFVQTVQGVAGLFLLQILLSGVLAVLAAGALSRQIRQIHQSMRRIRAGDKSIRIPPQKGQEFGLLGSEFNRLLDDFAIQEYRLSEQGKLLGWRETARFLSHQIKNPLTALSLAVSNLEAMGSLSEPLAQENGQIIREETLRLAALVNRLKSLTAFEDLKPERLDLVNLVRSLSQKSFPQPVQIDWPSPQAFVVQGDRFLLEQTFHNLITNSCEAARSPVLMSFHSEARSITVSDSITGLQPSLLPKLFQPPFTTKPGGTGLGLSFCKRIMQLHGGDINARLSESGGLAFILTFPQPPEVNDG